jgi:hypothetical protein
MHLRSTDVLQRDGGGDLMKACPNHPKVDADKRCSNCGQDYCSRCIEMTRDGAMCPDCAPIAPAAPPQTSTMTLVIIVAAVLFGLCAVTAIIAAIAIPNLTQARKHGNEATAIGALKTIGVCEAIFREGDKDQNGKLDYGTLAQLNQTRLVDSVLGSGTKQGYHFQVQPGTDTEFYWWAVAHPAVPGTTGDRVFFTNQKGVIYYLMHDDPHANDLPDPKTCDPPSSALPVGR